MRPISQLPYSRSFLVAICAVAMGYISGKLLLFNGSAMNILPWGLLAFAVSFIAPTKRQALKLAGIFWFLVSFSFLWFNNTEPKTPSSVIKVVVLAAFAALFGLVCGILLGWLGWKIQKSYSKKRPKDR